VKISGPDGTKIADERGGPSDEALRFDDSLEARGRRSSWGAGELEVNSAPRKAVLQSTKEISRNGAK